MNQIECPDPVALALSVSPEECHMGNRRYKRKASRRQKKIAKNKVKPPRSQFRENSANRLIDNRTVEYSNCYAEIHSISSCPSDDIDVHLPAV